MVSVVTGAAPGSLSARCVAFTVPLYVIIIFSFCRLIIDPAGRAVSAGSGLQRLDTTTQPGLVTLRTVHDDVSEVKLQELSVFGDVFDATPMVLPVRGHLDAIKRLLKGDLYMGRGSRKRSLAKSRYCNTLKVSQCIDGFRDALISDRKLHSCLWTLSGRRLVCHCRPSEACHGDVLKSSRSCTLRVGKLSLNCLFAGRNNNNFDLCRPPGN